MDKEIKPAGIKCIKVNPIRKSEAEIKLLYPRSQMKADMLAIVVLAVLEPRQIQEGLCQAGS